MTDEPPRNGEIFSYSYLWRREFDHQGVNSMTDLLECVVGKLRTLPDSEQNAIAALILDELGDEARWDEAFTRAPDALAKLADEALAEDRAGKTLALDPDGL